MTGKSGILLTTVATLLLASSLLIGCGGGAAPAPTSAPQPAAKPAEPTKAPAAPTTAAAQATTAAPAAPTKAAAPARTEGFFKGKTINIILPNTAGQGNDRSLRFVAPYIQEAAGAKDILVENLPGAGGMLGFNKFYTQKADGLNWGAGSVASMVMQQLSGQEGVRWDVSKVNYLARFYADARVLMAPAKGGVKTMDEALKLGRPLNLPIQGLDEDNLAMFLAINFLGLKGKLITGYQGETDVFLACMRGEGDWAMASRTTALPLIKNGDMVPVMILGQDKSPDFPGTPTVLDVLKDQSARESMVAVTNIMQLLISLYMPPGVDPGVVAEARYVVDKGLVGTPVVAEEMPKKTGGRPFAYMKGEDLQAKVNQIMSQSSKLVPVLKQATESIK